MATSKSKTRTRVGRPRVDQRPLQREPFDEIVYQASRLFAGQGYAGTSTRQIAEASGLRQSSLFHYFPAKEDILVAITERLYVKPLGLLERVEREDGSPPTKLFRVVYGEARHTCTEHLLLRAVLESSVELTAARFRRYHADDQLYRNNFARFVEAGITSRDFVDEPLFLATMRYVGMINWMLKWYRPSGGLEAPEIAESFARSYVRSLLRDPAALPAIERHARALGLPGETDGRIP